MSEKDTAIEVQLDLFEVDVVTNDEINLVQDMLPELLRDMLWLQSNAED